MSETIVTLPEAIAAKSRYYYTGIPCSRGHLSKRTVAKRECVECRNENKRRYRNQHYNTPQGTPAVQPEKGIGQYVFDGMKLSGASTMAKTEEGLPIWIKMTQDSKRQQEIFQATLDGMLETLPRAQKSPEVTKSVNENLLNCFVITDYHMGALSWEPETGADWDLNLAEATLIEWFKQAIDQAPKAKVALLAQLSDFLHWDGFDAVTPTSKHLLDADTRFPKLVRTAIKVLRQIIQMLLESHEQVHIIMADANHDPVSQVWLREWMSIHYEDDPRVLVDTSPSPYNCYEFGNTALFFHHGHKRKVSNVSEVFAANFREIYGRTKYAYAHMGHLHHVDIKENNLMIVEQHRTLAATDAYGARGGWVSGRDAKVITYHKNYGEVGRITISFDMVKETK